jgi:peptidoglycan/xylan/chitin deacetylase (PgdA/CDA1 family)
VDAPNRKGSPINAFARLSRLRHKVAQVVAAAPATIAPAVGTLSLSFDDFPASAWSEGGRVLADHGVKATYYVCGRLCGGRNMDLPQFEVADLEAVVEAGHEVGCHTFGHISTLKLSGSELRVSLDRNARWVAERLDGYRMTTFAFPFGDWTVSAKRTVAKRFAVGRGVRTGVNRGRIDRTGLSAIGLETYKLDGLDFDALAAETAAHKGWLIAYGHDVGDRPTAYGCQPEVIDRLIVAARRAGLAILPVHAAAKTMDLSPGEKLITEFAHPPSLEGLSAARP